jgi:peptide/nickel transport system substrate-binding protein
LEFTLRRSSATATAVSVLLLASACSGSEASPEPGDAAGGDALTLASIVPPSSFAVGEMASGGPANNYYQAVYDSLLSLDTDGQPVANLATEWTYDAAGTRLSLTLRDDVTFTDGAAFDAEAVKANLEQAKAANGEAASALRALDSVEVVDATHADLLLSRPDPGLLDALARSSGFIASPAALSSPDLATTPVGSGPYVLETEGTTAGSIYSFSRNEDYWNAEAYPFDAVEIRFIDDATATLNGLRSGELQGVAGVTKDIVAGAESAGLTVANHFNGTVEGMYLWDRTGALAPALGDVRVRQAMNHAIDRETVVEVVKGGLGTPTEQIFGPNSPGYDPSLEGTYEYDLERAEELMAEAGYADGFTVSLPDFSPVFPDEQAAMTEAMAAIDITLEFAPITADQVVSSIMGGQWPFNFFGLTAAGPFELASLALTPQSPFNPFKVDDPTVNDLVTRASTTEGDEQAAALQELSGYLVEQAWFVPWDAQQASVITADDVSVTPVEGVAIPPLSGYSPAGN